MKIYVDADACPVVFQVENTAKIYNIPVMLLCDTNHMLNSDYSEIKVVSAGVDAVDFALINLCQKGDVVVTQDYGVAAMALGKGAYCIHQSGKWYTDENIDTMLMERYISKKARRNSSRHHLKGMKKRIHDDNEKFNQSFIRLLEKVSAKRYCGKNIQHKVFGKKEENKKYYHRKAAYVIIFNEEGKVGIIQTLGDQYFLLGGKIEEGETYQECIRRECMEEAGIEVDLGDCLCKGERYFYRIETDTYAHLIGYFFYAKGYHKVGTPLEKGHTLLWLDVDMCRRKIYHEHQAWAVDQAYEKFVALEEKE